MRCSLTIVIFSALLLSGCSSLAGGLGRHDSATNVPAGGGILGQLRPKVDPRFLEKAKMDEMARQANQAAQMQALQQAQQAQAVADSSGRVLPVVSTDPISSQVADTAASAFSSYNPSTIGTVDPQAATAAPAPQPDMWNSAPIVDPNQQIIASSNKAASYGAYGGGTVPPPPPGSLVGGSLTPPPPAVTLSTQAAVPGADANNPYGNPYANPYTNPYANPYLNPYAVPYPTQYPQMMPQQVQPERPAGLFGSGQAVPRTQSDADPAVARKRSSFIPITPTGMEARSPYKQRDDLKVLWKGAMGSGQLGQVLSRDPKLAENVARVDVSLPADATKGSFSVGQRQVDSIFRPIAIDKRIEPQVRRVQGDLVQSYYRYLYTYNKFALAQQTSAARKQEAEVADTDSERQRALADQAQAQNEADSARDDMKSAQLELANAAGPNAARSIIGRVSGITPTADSISPQEPAQAPVAQNKGMFGLPAIGSLFNFGGNKAKADAGETAVATPLPAKAMVAQPVDNGKKVKVAKKKSKADLASADKAEAKAGDKNADKAGDLSAAPQVATAAAMPTEAAPAEAAAAPTGVSVELKGVNITARKSTLSVVIKNSGQGDFSFNTDDFSVAENNRKLSDAAMRADFDTTLVQPNQEVKGTITIFGRPWSDRLTVSLSDGSRVVQMRR